MSVRDLLGDPHVQARDNILSRRRRRARPAGHAGRRATPHRYAGPRAVDRDRWSPGPTTRRSTAAGWGSAVRSWKRLRERGVI